MPPKRKRVSSAHSACQAKKRKRNQRQTEQQLSRSHATCESLTFEERRCKHNVEAHRSARLDPDTRQHEQEQNTAARRQSRMENPDRRVEEQVRQLPDDSVTTLFNNRNMTRLHGAKFVWKTVIGELKNRCASFLTIV